MSSRPVVRSLLVVSVLVAIGTGYSFTFQPFNFYIFRFSTFFALFTLPTVRTSLLIALHPARTV